MRGIITKGLFIGLFVLAFTVSSCSKKTEYTQAIPADAAAVVSIDMKSLAVKSGINDAENVSLKQHLSDALKNGLNAETSDCLAKIMDDPSESGFDFGKPIYIYTAKEFNFSPVIALSVCDRGDLTSTLKALSKSQLCTEPEKADNFKYSVISGKVVLAYNKGTALCVEAPGGMTGKLMNTLDDAMTQKKEKSFRSTAAFDNLKQRKSDASFYFSSRESASAALSDSHSSSDLALAGDMDFRNGWILLKVEKYTGKNMSKSPGTSGNTLQPVSNVLLANFPKSLPLMFTTGVNGMETYKQLSGMFGFGTLDIPVFQKLIESIHGDLTVGYNAYDAKTVSFLAYAQIKDAASVKSIYGYVRGLKDNTWGTIEKKSANDFVYHFMKKDIYYGVAGNIMYITNQPTLIHYKPTIGTYAQNPYALQAKGKDFFFVVDANQLENPTLQKQFGALPLSLMAKNVICIRAYNTSSTTYNVEMIWKDKKVNALKQIVKIVRQTVGM